MSASEKEVTRKTARGQTPHGQSHMPENSFFFEKAVPVLLIVLGIVMTGLILFAAGVLVGLVQF